MLIKQLKDSCFDIDFVFLYEERLYEKLSNDSSLAPTERYRYLIREDDYDYVTDSHLCDELDAFVKTL